MYTNIHIDVYDIPLISHPPMPHPTPQLHVPHRPWPLLRPTTWGWGVGWGIGQWGIRSISLYTRFVFLRDRSPDTSQREKLNERCHRAQTDMRSSSNVKQSMFRQCVCMATSLSHTISGTFFTLPEPSKSHITPKHMFSSDIGAPAHVKKISPLTLRE